MEFKNMNKSQRCSMLKEYMAILKHDEGYSLATFCRAKKIKTSSMRSWLRFSLGISVEDIRNGWTFESDSASAEKMIDFVEVVPQHPNAIACENPVFQAKDNNMYGVSIVCPSGLNVNVRECTVDNLAFLMKALQA